MKQLDFGALPSMTAPNDHNPIQLEILRETNRELHNSLQMGKQRLEQIGSMKQTQLNNSLYSLMQGAENQSSLGSFHNLAYFNIYAPLTVNWTQLTYMYKTHGIIQTAIDMPVLDALRGGVDLHSDEISADNLKDLQDLIEKTGTLRTLAEVATWVRLYGGGALVINAKQDPHEPLEMAGIKKLELYAANRWELVSTHKDAEYFEFYGKVLHSSRVLTMNGKAAPYLVRSTLQGWGMSEIEKMIEPFNAYLRINDVIYELLREAKVDVYKFKNMIGQLASDAGTNALLNRTQIMNQIKNYQNAVVLDADDDFEQKQITFAGLAEMKKQNQVDVASALRIPMTKLFGLSAAGFNSGEDDIENYNAMIESEVREPLRPLIRSVIELRCLELFGETFDIAFSFKPLRVLSSVDEETVNTQKNARYLSLYDKGLLTGQEVMQLEQQEKLVSIQTEVGEGMDPEPPGGGLEDPQGATDEIDQTPTAPKQRGDRPDADKPQKVGNTLFNRVKEALFGAPSEPVVEQPPLTWSPQIKLEPKIDIVMPRVTGERTTLTRDEKGQIVGSTKENIYEGAAGGR